jgi:hypothetical protein
MFNRHRGQPFLIAIALFFLSHGSAADERTDGRAVFERLKTLAGTWESYDKAKPSSSRIASYEITGGGKVVIENMGGMLTAYHLDKGQLVMTHYCGAGNQPRMRMRSTTDGGRKIAFEMYDITNLTDPQSYHSTHLDLVFVSEDEIELAYKGKSEGRESTQVFHLRRKSR